MSYRIITYRDPYHLDNTSFWEEIHDLPHFCASSVMAMSMWDLYHNNKNGTKFASFFFPLDDLVTNAYDEWEGNIEKQIQQYSVLSWWLNEWEKADRGRRPELFSALYQNQNSLLDSLRMFCELNISPESLHKELANTEQKVFITLYHYITNYDGDPKQTASIQKAFEIKDTKIYQGQAFPDLISYEIREENKRIALLDKQLAKKEEKEARQAREKRTERKKRLEMMAAAIQSNPPRKIVIHGIHQFKPLQMRLIAALNEAGYEIIFLYNYLDEYKHLYETWERMYSLFGVPIEHSAIIREYKPVIPDETSMELAKTMAGILNAHAPVSGTDRSGWLNLAGKVKCTIYENTSEMANQVAELIRDNKDENTPNERIIYKLPEKIYSASRDADDLIKVYFPEYAGDRHFLQYPIGQFFTNLYQMWDEEKHQLILDIPSLKACAVSGILNSTEDGEQISGLLDLAAPLIEDLNLFSEVKQRLSEYRNMWNQAQSGILKRHLKHMALYNKQQINEKDIQALLGFLDDLKSAADFIFNQDGSISFKKHFENLEKYIRGKVEHLARVEEKRLVNELLERFDQVKETTDMNGTMDDLRHGLYFYMAQKKKEIPGWVIRNFEQIEGDVLKSQAQVTWQDPDKDEITYHFAALSDGMICKKVNELLPWPLTDHFTHAVYSPVALVFQVYYCALNDRQAYMQYALFYGLYFNRGQVKLSYIRHIDEKKEEQLYYPLQILNLAKEEYHSQAGQSADGLSCGMVRDKLNAYDPTRDAKMDFFLCPYRYYLDFVCSSEIVHSNPFMIRKFYESMLSNVFRSRNAGNKMNETQVRSMLEMIQNELDPFFPFLKNVNDKPDIRENALKYIMSKMMENGRVQNDDPTHALIREEFIKGAFYQPEDTHEEHPIAELRSLVKNDPKDNGRGTVENRKRYSLALIQQMNQRNPTFMKEYMANYLTNDSKWEEHPGEWCTYCRYKGLCKKPFMKTVEE